MPRPAGQVDNLFMLSNKRLRKDDDVAREREAFFGGCCQDQTLQQKLAAARERAEAVRLAVQTGSERGLPFTAEELQASLGPPPSDGSGELGDDQLESVAGGFPNPAEIVTRLLKHKWDAPREPTPSPQDVSLSHEPLHKA